MPRYSKATHGSFHTTISALEALLDYERFRPDRAAAAREAQPADANSYWFTGCSVRTEPAPW